MKTPTLNDLFPDAIRGQAGIFRYLNEFDVPWQELNIHENLDSLYYSRSGNKTSAPLVMAYVRDGAIVGEDYYYIAHAVFTIFGVNWQKLYDTLFLEYNPIENYRMTEQEEIETHDEQINTDTETSSREADNVRSDSGNIETENDLSESTLNDVHKWGEKAITDTGTLTTQNNLSESDSGTISKDAENERSDTGTIANDGETSNNNKIYGFNSSDAVDSDEQNGIVDNTETRNLTISDVIDEVETRNLTKTNTGTVTETHNLTTTEEPDLQESYNERKSNTGTITETRNVSVRDVIDESESRNETNSLESDGTQTREMTRSGNIGVTTSQQLIESERMLWEWNYFNRVFSDLDSVLALDVYDYSECEV